MASWARSSWLVSAWMNCSTGSPGSRSLTEILQFHNAHAFFLVGGQTRCAIASWEDPQETLWPLLFSATTLRVAHRNKPRSRESARARFPEARQTPLIPEGHH